MMNIKLVSTVAAVALVGTLGLAGCGSQASSSAASSATSSEASSLSVSESSASAQAQTVIGTQSEKGATFEVTNKTGKGIKGVSVKPTGEATYPANMMTSDQTLKNGETVTLACPEIPEPQNEGSDVAVKRMADVQITLSDDKVYELHQVDVYSVKSAELRLDGELAYIEYTTTDGEKVNTLEAEKGIAQQAAEQKQAEQQQAQGEQQADPNANNEGQGEVVEEVYYEEVYEEPVYEEPVYEEPVYEDYGYDDGGYVDDSAVGSGDEESCIPDIVLR